MAGLPLHDAFERPDPIERGAEALVDLYLPARCDYLIVDPSSTFGRVATLLTEAPAGNVFSVRSRGKPTRSLRRLSYGLWLGSGVFYWGLGGLAALARLTSWRARRTGLPGAAPDRQPGP